MAISSNILLQQLSGKLGKMIVVKNYNGKAVVSKTPDMSDRKLSPKQIDANDLMRTANEYAKYILGDPLKKEEAGRRLRVPDNKLYRAIIKDYLLKKGDV